MPDPLRNLRNRVNRARKPSTTCPASRHLHMMAEALAAGRTLESLWKARTRLGR